MTHSDGNFQLNLSLLGLLRNNLLLFALLLGGAQASWAQQDLSCTPDKNGVVKLGNGNLTCTGPGSKTVNSIQGNNGAVNIVTLQDSAELTVTNNVALDQQGGNSGNTLNGNTIDIDSNSSLLIGGKLTNHKSNTQGNPDVITNAGTLTVEEATDMYQWNDQITNSGTAEFTGLAMGSGDDTVTNEASGDLTVTGDLNLKMGADTVTNHGEMTVTGDITDVNQGSCGGSAESDQCGNSNNDEIVNTKILTVSGDIVLGSGAPCKNCGKNNESEDPEFKNWSDNDTLNNSGTLSVTNINFEKQVATGTDADTLINSGELTATGNITFGRDGDTLTNTGTLDVDGGIDFGSGNDTFSTGYSFNVGGIIDGGTGTNRLNFGDGLDHYFDGGIDGGIVGIDGGNEVTGEVKASNFKNWTTGYQLGGNWDFDGDFSDDGTGTPRIHTFILQDGTFRARDEDPPKFNIFEMDGGYIDIVKTISDTPSLIVKESFEYKKGSLIIDARTVQSSPTQDLTWELIEGTVINAEGLAENTFLVTQGSTRNSANEFEYTGLASEGNLSYEGDKGTYAVFPFYYAYLKEGSYLLQLVPKDPLTPPPVPGYCEQNPDDPLCNEPPPPWPEWPGCEDEDLCELLPGPGEKPKPGPPTEIIEILECVHDGCLELPLIDYPTLAKLVGSGLSPRNVDAPGRGLALHNNLLVDALFDRQPLRQFKPLMVTDEVVPDPVLQPAPQTEPVRGLWKTTPAGDGQTGEVNIAAAQATVVEVDGTTFVDQEDDELDLAKREGVSAWVKGFGGNSRADDSTILYNNYDLNTFGTSVGLDVALSETFQIGAYANYGDVNVQHLSGDTGGGNWNPEGWGGGLTAQYSTRNFYIQGLVGASQFSGEQSRNILWITNEFGESTARGEKDVTSYLGALRIGAPFQSGAVVLEPQAQLVWTQNQEQAFSEGDGTAKNLQLKYKSRTTNFAETELGMKLSVPFRTGDRALLVPILRAAWLADWNQGNEAQEIGYKFSKKTVSFDSQLETQNGALLEAGLDYTVQNFNRTSVKLFGRAGVEFWDSDRGTTWRTSGGVTFQF